MMNEHPKYYITYMKFHADAIHDSATVIHKGKMMNERIRQLYYECQDESQSTEQCYQKFAELIVQECVGVCESMQLIGPYKEVQDATLKDAVVQIKQHFGVEK